ncbi:MAG: hypothetical protein NC087_02910 [Anaeroplasma bactoclasticum]|nr:hypothetical protein [Anaeroplasma bactoclasticum]
MAEIIMGHFKSEFVSLIRSSNRKIVLSSQFIRMDVLEKVLKNISSNLEVEVLTSTNLCDYLSGNSDIDGLELLVSRGIKIRSMHGFNNQLFFFDDKVFVSSFNMNELFLTKKNEFGVLFSQQDEVQKFRAYYQRMIKNNTARQLSPRDIKTIKKCYKKLNHKCKYSYDADGDLILQIHNIEDLTQEISAPWQKNMLLYINSRITTNKFCLQDIYLDDGFFNILYPNNKTIEARMRRTLQELRDFGLIKFYGNGTYKILWKTKD